MSCASRRWMSTAMYHDVVCGLVLPEKTREVGTIPPLDGIEISLVVPTLNEALNLPALAERVDAAEAGGSVDHHHRAGCQRHRDDARRVAETEAKDQQGHQRIHAEVARVADHDVTGGRECAFNFPGDGRIEADVPREALTALVARATLRSPVANTLHDGTELNVALADAQGG